MAVVLDSDAVIGFLDRDDALHGAADSAVRKFIHDRLLVSVITYAEVMTGVRLGHHDDDQVAGFFRGLISEILPVESAIADKAAELRARHKSLQMPDALVLATAEVDSDVELVITGDRRVATVDPLSCETWVLGSH